MVDPNFQATIKKRFAELPAPVRNAITSADIQKQLRALADTHKLHLDQWEILENEVLMALYGITPIDQLQQNIQTEVKVSAEVAATLATDISKIVFEPIRQELERELEHPDAKAEQLSGAEQARKEILGSKEGQAEKAGEQAALVPVVPAAEAAASPIPAPAPSIAPATPPPPPPTEKAVRVPSSGAYKSGEPSHIRKDVHDDPYRETPA